MSGAVRMKGADHVRLARLAGLLRQVATELDSLTARVSGEAMAEARKALGAQEEDA